MEKFTENDFKIINQLINDDFSQHANIIDKMKEHNDYFDELGGKTEAELIREAKRQGHIVPDIWD